MISLSDRLLRYPTLLALWFEWRNRLRAFAANRGEMFFSVLAATALMAVVIAMIWQTLHASGAEILSLTHDYPIVATLTAAAVGFSVGYRTRGEHERRHAQSWLASLPLRSGQLRVAFGLAAAVRLIGLVTAIALAYAMMVADAADYPWLLVGLFVLATSLGMAAGWRLARPRRHHFRPRYRFARQGRALPTVFPATLGPLGRWPIREQHAVAQPKRAAYAAGAMLLLLPMGIPPLVALSVLAWWLLLIKLAAYGRLLIGLTPAAARWLRATPLPFVAFARSYALPSLLLLSMGFVVESALGMVLGLAPVTAGLIHAGIFGLVVLGLACAYATRFRPPRATLESILCVVVLGAVAQSAAVFALPTLLLLCLWQWRRAIRQV